MWELLDCWVSVPGCVFCVTVITISCLTYFPATARLAIVGEVVADPLVDLAEGHPFARRAVDREGDEASIAVGGFAVSVLRSFLLVQRGPGIQMHNFLGGPVAMMVHMVQVPVVVPVMVVVVVVACVCLLDGSSHAKLRQPVHGGQATLKFGGHSSLRSKSEEETETLSGGARRITWLTGWVLSSGLGSSLEEQEVCLLCLLIFNWSRDTQMLTCTFLSTHTHTH